MRRRRLHAEQRKLGSKRRVRFPADLAESEWQSEGHASCNPKDDHWKQVGGGQEASGQGVNKVFGVQFSASVRVVTRSTVTIMGSV